MRVVVLGASSFSTPHLARYLATRDDTAPITLVLAGRTSGHIAAVGRASRILIGASPVRIETASAARGQWEQCLVGADIVVVQVRVGGYEARRYDETFPLGFGLCGDEGLGPGGLAAAWRTWPVLRGILAEVTRVCPGAYVLLLTSPVGLLVRLARVAFSALNLAGVCELPFTTLCAEASARKLRWTELEWQYIGVNHIGWIYGLRHHTLGCLPSLPLKYVRLQTAKPEVLAQQKASPGQRAIELAALAKRVLHTYAQGSPEEIEQALSLRRADWYEAAVGPLIAVHAGAKARSIFFLSVPQRGWRPEFETDDVLEIPHVATHRRLLPRPNPVEPPPEMLEQTLALVRFERVAARAVMAHDRREIEHAISCHPWVSNSIPVGPLAARVCAASPPVG